MSGRLTRDYYEHIVDEVNRAEPDIVAITGDIVEGDKFCDWFPSTFGRLESRFGAITCSATTTSGQPCPV